MQFLVVDKGLNKNSWNEDVNTDLFRIKFFVLRQCTIMNLSKYFTCLPLWIYPGNEALKLNVSLIQVYLWKEPLCIDQMYSWLYLNLSYILKKRWLVLGSESLYFVLGETSFQFLFLFGTALPSLLTKSVPSWLFYEERSLLFCSKTFPVCFSDLSEFHLGQWWHPFCTCVMALHFYFFSFKWLSSISSLYHVWDLLGAKALSLMTLTFPGTCGMSKSNKKLSCPSDFTWVLQLFFFFFPKNCQDFTMTQKRTAIFAYCLDIITTTHSPRRAFSTRRWNAKDWDS